MKYNPGKAAKADLEFCSKSKDFFNVMVGYTKFDQGFSSGIYTIHGSITDAVKLMRLAELAFESHSTLDKIMKAMSRMFM